METKKSMREQLDGIRKNVKQTSRRNKNKSNKPNNGNTERSSQVAANVNRLGDDGVDHINLFRDGKTDVGRLLCLDHVRSWEHEILGPFRSLNTLMYFLRAKHRTDLIRTMVGSELHSFVQTRCGGFGDRIPYFREIILDSIWRRVKVFNDLSAALTKSTLPFDCYRENEVGLRFRFGHSPWLILGYEEIRRALKEGREPNFRRIADYRPADVGLYDPILEELMPNRTFTKVTPPPVVSPAPAVKIEPAPVQAPEMAVVDGITAAAASEVFESSPAPEQVPVVEVVAVPVSDEEPVMVPEPVLVWSAQTGISEQVIQPIDDEEPVTQAG